MEGGRREGGKKELVRRGDGGRGCYGILCLLQVVSKTVQCHHQPAHAQSESGQPAQAVPCVTKLWADPEMDKMGDQQL